MLVFLWGPVALAAPDALVVTNDIATARGNQSGGIASGVDFNTPPITTLNVNSLSQPIQPPPSSPGIVFKNNSGGNVFINNGDGPANAVIRTTGDGGAGIIAESTGTPPPNPPDDPFLLVPNPTASTNGGGQVRVTNQGEISTAGNNAPGIRAKSSATGYPETVLQELRGFPDQGFAFAVNWVGTLTNLAEPVFGTLRDTNGTVLPGVGGVFVIAPDGSFGFNLGTNFDFLAVGQSAQATVNYGVVGSNPANYVESVPSTLTIWVTRDTNGVLTWEPGVFSTRFEARVTPVLPGTAGALFPDLTNYVARLVDTASAGGTGSSVSVTNLGTIITTGSNSFGIYAESAGGAGPGGRGGSISHSAGAGGSGRDGGAAKIHASGTIITSNAFSAAVVAVSRGGSGGPGGNGGTWRYGARGGNGGTAGDVEILGNGLIRTFGHNASGILGVSEGGNGGNGGSGKTVGGGNGGYGGSGGDVLLDGAWNIITEGNSAYGIWGKSVGGSAGSGGSGGWLVGTGGGGGVAADGGEVSISSAGSITTLGEDSYGIYGESIGGFGGSGGGSYGLFYSKGGDANSAGSGGAVSVTHQTNGTVATFGTRAHAILAQSIGGGGGAGGTAGALVALGGDGGSGGNGGAVAVTNYGVLTTAGTNAIGILAQSVGGGGGTGASSGGGVTAGGAGSGGGNGGVVTVFNAGAITNFTRDSHAILAQSIGGGGGNASGAGGAVSLGGDGGAAGHASNVMVFNSGKLLTWGDNSRGLFIQSVGGGGGSGAGSGGVVSLGGKAQSGGNGANVQVANTGEIETFGAGSHAFFAQSVGGGGGSGGGSGGLVSLGGAGESGGTGGSVWATNSAALQASGPGSRGIFAQSVGGGGGDGAGSGGLVSLGGAGSGTSDGGSVMVFNSGSITSTAHAIFVQSVGGGGGNGGSSGGLISIGGSAGGGGNGSFVSAFNFGSLNTFESDSSALFVQSVGGGGGNGGSSGAGGPSFSLAIGGSGGKGGHGDWVNVVSGTNTIATMGDRSHGIFAQSVGGGGGNGGSAVAVSLGKVALSVAIGGSGAGGGSGSNVLVRSDSAITTLGTNAHGIFAQSVGGGGGSGGFSVAASMGAEASGAISVGGNGGKGGSAESVTVSSSGDIHTFGERSYGILAQSLGGGGGDGGFSVAATLTLGGAGGAGLSFGGSGSAAGAGGVVDLFSSGNILTEGKDAHALFAQSVGGGGGSGGFSVAGNISGGAALGLSFGGSGAGGGSADDVALTSQGTLIRTAGEHAYGLLAQSVGGGGGDGGFSVAGGISQNASVNFSMGGGAGIGSQGGKVSVTNASTIITSNANAHAIFVQSVGGGGGSGGFSVSGSLSAQGPAIGASVGGKGGGGGLGGNVTVISSGRNILTHGERSFGILAQSIGGGGGDGGFSVAGGLSKSAAVNFSIGGAGGPASSSGTVLLDSASTITTLGADSHGIMVQSVGGGGGAGGFSVAGSISIDGPSIGASIGGSGGSGGNACTVALTSRGRIDTFGQHAYGLLAQSIGGGGGDGGFSVEGGISKGPALNFAIGGAGGAGGAGGLVSLTNTGDIITRGEVAYGLVAQSVGGGGGSGGFAISGGLSKDSSSLSFSLGGAGGPGSYATNVVLANSGNITTSSRSSHGVVAQSIGGGGGAGGFAGSLAGGFSDKSASLSISIGGSGGTGGTAGLVFVTNSGAVFTHGESSYGILAQSVGGGGGDGGFGLSANLGTGEKSLGLSVAVGGSGASGGRGEAVAAVNYGQIATWGSNSYGIFAQSLGGGGGNGGMAAAGSLSTSTNANQINVSVGGRGGTGNDAGVVAVGNYTNVFTHGESAVGILAQSIGGGGGNGGNSFAGSFTREGARTLGVTVGGSAGAGGDGNLVQVTNAGGILTAAREAHGIFAQSVGGGGGKGGSATTIAWTAGSQPSNAVSLNLNVAIGGNGGAAGYGSNVVVRNEGRIQTSGENAYGIFAQSVGGGGGYGGDARIQQKQPELEDLTNIFTAPLASGLPDTASSQVTNETSETKSWSVNLAVGIGGKAGSGGVGGKVHVENLGEIVTLGRNSSAIFAQSVGGGGGVGGSTSTETGGGQGDRAIQLGFGLGGAGGQGNSGDTVTVNHSGSITTLGDASHGIFAQSVGGGGGAGGATASSAAEAASNTTVSISANVNIGGDGGAAGDGGHVLVTNQGSIVTVGVQSYGILAQSVGGGGGFGGNASIKKESEAEEEKPDDSDQAAFRLLSVSAASENGSSTNNASEGEDKNWSVNVAVGAGGAGGSAGHGGKVTVNNLGSITNYGRDSVGIFAQSVGGGGGVGGSSTTDTGGERGDTAMEIGVSLGGRGGGGGSADDVIVTSKGTIVTFGDAAHGIFAQSVGGGGGAGGAGGSSISDAGTNTSVAINVSVGVGGSGGLGGHGSNVVARNEGRIQTEGENAYGIFAQSVGGGGGNGGDAKIHHGEPEKEQQTNKLGAPLVLTEPDRPTAASTNGIPEPVTNNSSWSINLAVGIGGKAGGGGTGGRVTVENVGEIVTLGRNSSAVFAQSVGGGGGVGGSTSTETGGGPGDRAIQLGFGLGGTGGQGNSSETVILNNSGSIATRGDTSHGIFAQSVGGGGGAGGASATTVAAAASNTTASVTANVNVGGDGGVAGNGGNVFVTNQGSIVTVGIQSYGILAQSVGGGGGFGGNARVEREREDKNQSEDATQAALRSLSGTAASELNSSTNNAPEGEDVNWSVSVAVGAGGAGGSAGNGGKVTVNNLGNITDYGRDSVGIFAQSVGGGGGVGGASTTDSGGERGDTAVEIGISLGGKGGAGGSAEAVSITSEGAIVTYGDSGHAIFAQSVGGGGGSGGASGATVSDAGTNTAMAVNVTVGVGGSAGVGGNGGDVEVENRGLIDTSGRAAFGILAQSIGGGGGIGGAHLSGPSGGSNTTVNLGVGVGGSGGASGSGGGVSVLNTGTIVTRGQEAHGIFAQSVGGGGGQGGVTTFSGGPGSSFDINIGVGGSGGSSGDGGVVTVRQAGDITTAGRGAIGVFAQSVGGGGGVGGQGSVGNALGTIGIGGAGGAGGKGGDVRVDMTGNITTLGVATHGIFAQSVGGGGGMAGNLDRGLTTTESSLSDLGVGIAVGRDGGAGGDGGAVTIRSAGRIVTVGDASCGIFAQSVGGGGGLAGSLGNDLQGWSNVNAAGSAGAAGSGGIVTIIHTGDIFTLGNHSHGIFLQSAGGLDDGGKIRLEFKGSIIVEGTNSDAVFVQSAGGRANEDMEVTLMNGDVRGGYGSAGVRLRDGANNTLNNFSTISTRGDQAVVGGSGDDTLHNDGRIIGSIDLGTGRNALDNYTAGRLDSGPLINLGAGNQLLNAGTLAPGGGNRIQQTALRGNLLETDRSRTQFKLGSAVAYDQLNIAGTARLDGRLVVARYQGFLPKKGDEFTLLIAQEGLTGRFSSVADPLKGNYALRLGLMYGPDSLAVQTLQDGFLQFAQTPNQQAVALNLDTFSGLGAMSGDCRGAALIEYLNTIPGPTLASAFDRIAPEELGSTMDSMAGAVSICAGNTRRRLSELRSGSAGFGSLSLYDPRGRLDAPWGKAGGGGDRARAERGEDDWNVFVYGSGQLVDVESTSNTEGYDIETGGATVGVDRRLGPNFAMGIAAGYVGHDADLSNGGELDVNGGRASLYATWFGEAVYLEGSLGGGLHYFDSRRIGAGGAATGETEGSVFDALLGGGYEFKQGRFSFGPVGYVQYTRLNVNGFTESGSLSPLVVEDITKDSLLTQLGGRVGYSLPWGGARVQPDLWLTWQHEYFDTDAAIDARMASGAGSLFRVHSPEAGRDSLAVSAGMTIQWSERFTTAVYYDGELARKNHSAHGFHIGLGWSF